MSFTGAPLSVAQRRHDAKDEVPPPPPPPLPIEGAPLAVESVMPGIWLSKDFTLWNEENLRAHNFTHIIIIDKHIQELYYPSPVFKLAAAHSREDPFDTLPFEYVHLPNASALSFSKDFEVVSLNFGEKSYLTNVLPNCYRAVKFIDKALQGRGALLVIDCNGGEQKCLTLVVAYLMYKNNISFSAAFERLKGCYERADLDRFYASQLYEYEPILQVQRAQSRGQSCSRHLLATLLKRKKHSEDEEDQSLRPAEKAPLLDTLNPLAQFNAVHEDYAME